jgi:tyrosine-protein phosphatase SIW14
VWLIQWAKSRSTENEFGVPVRNFGKVTDGIYRGALPDAAGYRALVNQLAVVRVCSMIERDVEHDRRLARACGIEEWLHLPFSDRAAPQPSRVRHWLDFVRTGTRAQPVFIHCRGGRHRTGTLVAVLRVTDCGWNREQALKEMLRYGWYDAQGHRPLLDWFLHEFDPEDFRA